jgi:hypothetical protein
MCNIFIPLDPYNVSLIQSGKFKEKGKHKLRSLPQLQKKKIYLKALHISKANYNWNVNMIYLQFGFICTVTKHYKILPWFPQNYTGLTDEACWLQKQIYHFFFNWSILTNCSINLSIVHEHSPSTNQSNQLHEGNTSTCITEATQPILTCGFQIQLGLTEPKNEKFYVWISCMQSHVKTMHLYCSDGKQAESHLNRVKNILQNRTSLVTKLFYPTGYFKATKNWQSR